MTNPTDIEPATTPVTPVVTTPHLYTVREIFHSLQGEGARAGSVNVFLRFAFCNLQCSIAKEGFNCDTDFSFGDKMTAEAIVAMIQSTDASPDKCGWIIATGGEPTLQLDAPLVRLLWDADYKVAIETNGTHRIKTAVDWVSVSPKPGHPCVLKLADECRIVLKAGQLPDAGQLEMAKQSERCYVSPAFYAPRESRIAAWNEQPHDLKDLWQQDNVDWCVKFCKDNPKFSLSLQSHKILGLR